MEKTFDGRLQLTTSQIVLFVILLIVVYVVVSADFSGSLSKVAHLPSHDVQAVLS